jgi:hypothetical protein
MGDAAETPAGEFSRRLAIEPAILTMDDDDIDATALIGTTISSHLRDCFDRCASNTIAMMSTFDDDNPTTLLRSFQHPRLLTAISDVAILESALQYSESIASQAQGEPNSDSFISDLHDAPLEAPENSFIFDAPKSLWEALSRPDAREWADALQKKRFDIASSFADGQPALERVLKRLVPPNAIVKRSCSCTRLRAPERRAYNGASAVHVPRAHRKRQAHRLRHDSHHRF